MKTRPAQCYACALYRQPGLCAAYPQGIPDSMLIEGGDHRQARSGDHGVRFRPSDSTQKLRAWDDWESTYNAN